MKPLSFCTTASLIHIDLKMFRQFDHKRSPRPDLTLHFDGSMMRMDKLLCDRQPQPALGTFSARSVAAPETVENKGKIFGCNPRAGVPDHDPHASLLA